MKYQGIIFDLDGTLLDSVEDLADSMNCVLENQGFPTHEVEKYKYFIGDGMETLVLRTLPKDVHCDETIFKCVEGIMEEYNKRWSNKTKPYQGIIELLEELNKLKIRIGVLSNKPNEFVKMCVERFFPNSNFSCVYGERTGVPKKPDPMAALEIAGRLGIAPERCIYVGDTNTDMETGTRAGMYTLGVLWGFRGADELLSHGAKELICRPDHLLKFFASQGS